MKMQIDKERFGPWALITGASSGIGREFARQVAGSGIHVVLVARRENLLEDLGRELTNDFHVRYRLVTADLSLGDSMEGLVERTKDLDIGLVVSNAGTGNPGEFLKIELQTLETLLRLNTLAHLQIAHFFGRKLAQRRQGGLLLVGAMGAETGVPCLANDGAAKAYVHSLGEGLHVELKPLGISVTVLAPGFTDTPVLAKFGFNPQTMLMKPMNADQCVAEGLRALQENRSMIIPGKMNRLMNAVIPASFKRNMTTKMFAKVLANNRSTVCRSC